MSNSLNHIDVYVLDMDGTIYLGDHVINGAIDFTRRARAGGKRILYFTNNASRNKSVYFERLTQMGFAPDPGDILTSGDVTAAYLLTHHKNDKIFVLGTPALRDSFTEYGLRLTDGLDANVVVTSFDTTLIYSRLETACRLISGGAVYYSTHEDINCPTEYGSMPDSGAINALITCSTGKSPKYFGKPNRETAEMISEYTNTPFERIACVGDRLYTDIALGKRHGLYSILVLTGEAKQTDINEENAPDLVVDSISCLLNK